MDVSLWKLRLVAFCLGVCIAITVGELAVRWLLPQPVTTMSPNLYEEVDDLRFRMAPGETGEVTNRTEFTTPVTIDAFGLRSTRRQPPPEDALRLLFVGDSFTFGWGVGDLDTFSARLGASLSSGGHTVWAMNGGVPGYGPPDEALWFERYGLRLEPDAVVLCLFIGNDLADATPARRAGSIVYDMPEASTMSSLRQWLFRHSQLFRLGRRAVPWSVREQLGMSQPWTHLYLRDMFESYAVEPGEKARIGRAESRRAITELVANARQRELPIAAVLIPAAFQLDPDLFDMMVGLLDLDGAELDPTVPAQFFSGVFEDLGVPTLDLAPTLRQRLGEDPPLYFQYDPHWTPAGHQLAADTIRPFLLDLWPTLDGSTTTSRDLEDPGSPMTDGTPTSASPSAAAAIDQ